jgi:pyruvate dehydrogenase E2 component (dihydrolipoamide acetyltransferase)
MAEAVLMPKSGISVESCIIGAWRKQVGDEVKIGDILFDYETDKASFECESTAAGVLLELFADAGAEVEVLKPVCAIGAAGDDLSAIRAEAGGSADGTGSAGGTGSATTAGRTGATAESSRTDSEPVSAATPVATTAAQAAAQNSGVSPRAKNLAEKLGVDVQVASPSGPGGRVIARDVEQRYRDQHDGSTPAQWSVAEEGSSVSAGQTAASAGAEYRDEPMPKIRRLIAANMVASLQNTAQLTHHHSFDATLLLELRKQYKEGGAVRGLGGISVGDMILYAVSRTLRDFPYMNSLLLEGDVIRSYETVHLGLAVDTPRGLMVPTIFHADRKSLKEISDEVKFLAEMARSGKINPDLLQGATFTVSNLGPTGVEMFTPILNPPQVGILGVCGSVTRVKAGPGGPTTYSAIGLSLTYDHRAVDGAPASRFATQLARNLEAFPLLLTEG